MKKKIIPIIAIVICIAVIGGIVLMNKKPVENVAAQEQEETVQESVAEATPEPVETLPDNSTDDSNEQGNTTGYNVTEPSNTGIESNAGSLSSDLQEVPQDYIQYEEFEPKTLTVQQYANLLADFNYSKGETVGVGSAETGMEYTVDAKGTYNGEEYYRVYRNPDESHTTEFYFIIPVTAFEAPTQSEQQQSSTQQEYDEWGFPVIQFGADGWPINPGVEYGGLTDEAWERFKNDPRPGHTPQDLVNQINNHRKILRETMDAPVQGLESTTVSDHDGIDRENDPNYNGEYEYENPDKIGSLRF